MAVRNFNGTSDQLTCAVGGMSGMTYGTAAALVKFSDITDFRAVGYLHTSGGTYVAAPLYLTNTDSFALNDNTGDSVGSAASVSVWYLAVVRKTTGTTTPRFSVYNYSTTTWTHTAGSTTRSDWTAPGAGGNVQFSYQAGAGDFFASRIAARAYWANTLPWTADASGDTAIQSANLHTTAASWLSNNPSAFWLFNQASTGTSVDDLSTTGTADQSSITGTTVVNGDDPPGFDFALTAVSPPPVAVQAAGPWPAF